MNVPQTMEHGYVSDQSDFEQIIWEFEHKEEGQPLFLFNVTIQNHGSYTVKDYPAQVQLADQPGKYPMAEQYLTLANKTDEAFKTLVDYFSQCDEPTIIVMFGDTSLGGAGIPGQGLWGHPGSDDHGAVHG